MGDLTSATSTKTAIASPVSLSLALDVALVPSTLLIDAYSPSLPPHEGARACRPISETRCGRFSAIFSFLLSQVAAKDSVCSPCALRRARLLLLLLLRSAEKRQGDVGERIGEREDRRSARGSFEKRGERLGRKKVGGNIDGTSCTSGKKKHPLKTLILSLRRQTASRRSSAPARERSVPRRPLGTSLRLLILFRPLKAPP